MSIPLAPDSVGVAPDRVTVVYPGQEKLSETTGSRSIGENRLRVLYVGNLYPWKGLGDLTEAFRRILSERLDLSLTVVGTGPLLSSLSRIAKRDPRIQVTGYLDEAQKALQLRSADIFVYPSRLRTTFGLKRWEEQFGHSVVEAMNAGLATIVTDCGALPEVVNDSGMVIPQRSPVGLAAGIVRLSDSVLRRALGERAERRARAEFDPDTQAAKFAKVVRKTIDQ